MTDLYGYDVALDSDEAREAWRDLNIAFLAHGASTPDHLGRLLKAAPEFAIAEACRGLFSLLLGRRELVATAREALTKAKTIAAASEPDVRTAAYVDALETYLAGKPSRAAQLFDTLLETHPQDAMAVKLGHAIKFILGDSMGMRASLEGLMPQ
ncbi:MAG: tetratricopeptide repeat protein, partial [Hyphomicrobiaceae bacterium]